MTKKNQLLSLIKEEVLATQKMHEKATIDVSCKSIDELMEKMFQNMEAHNMGTVTSCGTIYVYNVKSENEKVQEPNINLTLRYVKVAQTKYVRLGNGSSDFKTDFLTDLALKLQGLDPKYEIYSDPLAKHGLMRYVEHTFNDLMRRPVIPEPNVRDEIATGIIQAYILGDLSPETIGDRIKDLTKQKPEYAKSFNQAMTKIIYDPSS